MSEIERHPNSGSNTVPGDACQVCGRPIVDNQWFCRLPPPKSETASADTARVLLCSPPCALRHFADSRSIALRLEPNYDGYEDSTANT